MDIEDTRIPKHLIPKYLYVGTYAEYYYGYEGAKHPPIKEVGLRPITGQFKHTGRRRDSIYLSASPQLAMTYARLYREPIVLKVDAGRLSKSKFYYDPDDIGTLEEPIQMAYRGSIPAKLISVHSGERRAMKNEQVAKELLKLAKQLTAKKPKPESYTSKQLWKVYKALQLLEEVERGLSKNAFKGLPGDLKKDYNFTDWQS